jgi:LAGLIDADG endonuclease
VHVRELGLLMELQEFFGCGTIVKYKTKAMATFTVGNLQDLIKYIIPHFENYGLLLTQKAADFILFKQIIELMNCKVHLTEEGLKQIVNIRATLN